MMGGLAAPVLAASPLLVVVGLMLGLRWRAALAGLAGLLLAIALAVAHFGLGGADRAPAAMAAALGGALLEALFTSATILWIILPALAIYEMQSRSGALEKLREAIGRVSDEPRAQVLLLAWFFGLFLEGVAGFGAPVALTAPMLVGLGFGPARAVVLALLGHAAGVSFGALGTPVLAQAALLPIGAEDIAWATAVVHVTAGWVLLASLVWLAGEGRPAARDWLLGALAGAAFYIPFLALARWAGPELPTIGGAVIGGLVFAGVASRGRRGAPRPAVGGLGRAVLPYLVIVLLVLITRLTPSVAGALRSIEIAWSLDGFGGRMQPLYHPGTMLAAGFLAGAMLQGRSRDELFEAAAAAVRRLGPVALALAAMLALSRIMVHSGMIAELAGAAANSAGLWPLLAPFVGVLGTFVTGSATASNILLTPFQAATAAELRLSSTAMAAAQGFGAAIGNVVCPHNIIAGGATVGLKGREGEVLARTAGPCLAAAALGGAALLLTGR